MEITSKEKMITFAMIGLCAVIGIMSFLAVVYYGQASGMNTQSAHLQSTIDQLITDKADLESQVNSLNTQVADLMDQLTTLTKENARLTSRLSKLMQQMNTINDGVDKTEIKATYVIENTRPLLSDKPPTLSKDRDIIR